MGEVGRDRRVSQFPESEQLTTTSSRAVRRACAWRVRWQPTLRLQPRHMPGVLSVRCSCWCSCWWRVVVVVVVMVVVVVVLVVVLEVAKVAHKGTRTPSTNRRRK